MAGQDTASKISNVLPPIKLHPMDNVILSQIPIDQLIEQIRSVVRQEMKGEAIPGRVTREIITGDELCKRLGLSIGSLIRYRKKRRIPWLEVGSSIRYDFEKVCQALEKK